MSSDKPRSFYEIVEAELPFINARRDWAEFGRPLEPYQAAEPGLWWHVALAEPSSEEKRRDERGRRIPYPTSELPLTGLALSGGGIRSASFCLGVLQGLDAVNPDSKPQVLDAIDYLSTVSGGGYIGTSLVSALMQTEGKFPFESKTDQRETLETQYLRDHSRYLAPNGLPDIVIGIVAVIRGLLVNAIALLAVLLPLAALTVWLNPVEAVLRRPHFFSDGSSSNVFLWTLIFSVAFVASQLLYVVYASFKENLKTLRLREKAGRILVVPLVAAGFVAWLELQAYILAAMFEAGHLRTFDHGREAASPLASVLFHLPDTIPAWWTFLGVAAASLTAFGGKLSTIARATIGDATWTGFVKHWASRIAIYAAGFVVPLVIWSVYLTLSYWAIGWQPRPGEICHIPAARDAVMPACLGFGYAGSSAAAVHSHAPDWLAWLAGRISAAWSDASPFAAAYLLIAIAFAVYSAVISPNAGSLNSYYRDRLSRAFLWQRRKIEAACVLRETGRPLRPPFAKRLLWAVSAAFASDADGKASNRFGAWLNRGEPWWTDVDIFKLSPLKSYAPDGETPLQPDVSYAPFLLINSAVNLEGSAYLNRRGRNADSFTFSPLHTGSEATLYARTSELEAQDPRLNIGAAMAISGAAASANMGASTIKPLTFSLAVLNVRLGYWLRNPRRLAKWRWWDSALASIGPFYFVLETLGRLNEWTRNVYLTDGGHFDNLGLYELLKRRCRVIIAVDAEADPPMNFDSLIRLQRYARIDRGIRIDLPWEDIRRFVKKITKDDPHGPLDDAGHCHGPHVAVGRIDYGDAEPGVLIYIKASMSGDENDLVRDYQRRNNDFPHETTIDQFFTEEQFEAYRALGFHAAESFFSGRDRFGLLAPRSWPDWPDAVDGALKRLNVGKPARDAIIRRQALGLPIT